MITDRSYNDDTTRSRPVCEPATFNDVEAWNAISVTFRILALLVLRREQSREKDRIKCREFARKKGAKWCAERQARWRAKKAGDLRSTSCV